MKATHWKDCEDVKVEKFPYKGEFNEVIGTSIRWLSKHGDDGNGYPEYGLRFFTVQPGGQIPIHNHFYHQTMYILAGEFECWEFNPETGEKSKKEVCGPGTAIYISSMEPHGMKNISNEPGKFLFLPGVRKVKFDCLSAAAAMRLQTSTLHMQNRWKKSW